VKGFDQFERNEKESHFFPFFISEDNKDQLYLWKYLAKSFPKMRLNKNEHESIQADIIGPAQRSLRSGSCRTAWRWRRTTVAMPEATLCRP